LYNSHIILLKRDQGKKAHQSQKSTCHVRNNPRNLFTNPANDSVNVEINGIPGKIKIELTSVEGKSISTQLYPDGLNLQYRLDLKETIKQASC